ncbi:glycoside hydrolase family 43 protein [Anaerophaga thermohalophila]|uniref:glycoside hydrolase family 43 protein n=1 Tax=Anaerophaga thermohalophila TaxID=177400 RepID=UPI0002D8430A|nr:glycoside hydrolase 43 family protein [Anaerophaga thermohalophila]
MKLHFSIIIILISGFLGSSCSEAVEKQFAHNPIIFADVPDMSMIRVDDTYYMSSTTMHMSPGVPIMKSKDLVNWEIVNYAYDTLANNEALRLENGQNAYGRGSWASSLRYHEDTFYISTFSATSGKTHIYKTTNIEKGPWEAITFEPVLHDNSLFFDDDGKVYMIYGGGDIRIAELKEDLSGIKPDGINRVIIPDAGKVASDNLMLHAEGSQVIKHNGKYYVFNITWPRGGMRTVVVHRADQITGPYEGKVALKDRGIAQGSIIDTPEGEWYAYMFRDYGSVGRIPYIMPMKWKDGWPVLGMDGKVPDTLDIPVKNIGASGIVTSDDFEDDKLALAWQWNHNPDNRYWSLTEREGYLRLTNGRIDGNVEQTRNTLTQRTFGPVSSASTLVDVQGMKDGDVAGLVALQNRYGFVGVKMSNGSRSVVMVSAETEEPVELETVPLEQDKIWLKIDCDFRNRTDKAWFYYSLNGEDWKPIGETLQMAYTLPQHFMGYRFGLFSFATETTGGFVDFDHFKISDEIIEEVAD